MIVCAVTLLGIGIFMYVNNSVASGFMWPRFSNPQETSITWHTPIFAGILFLLIAFVFLFDRKTNTAQAVTEKRTYLFGEIADCLRYEGFRKRGSHFFKRNGEVGYCINIHNDKCNYTELIRFTLNIGIYADRFWLEQCDFNRRGDIPAFPKYYDCEIRMGIGKLLPEHEDKWYNINANTNVEKLWNCIENDLTQYVIPFLANYNKDSQSVPNQDVYRKGGK